MTNYKGYFSNQECELYVVEFISDTGNSNFTEITLGQNPFVVSYSASDTPFDPYRPSTAAINVVGDDYLFDLLTPHADGVIVNLKKIINREESETDPDNYTIEWTGYLQGNVLNQPYGSCIENFTLNANDCLNVLSHFDYEQAGTLRQIISFKDLIVNIISRRLPNIKAFYWPMTKKDEHGGFLHPYELTISEQNFFSDDPEDEQAWKMDEVLTEMCRYIGVTALQWKSEIYFVDYQAFTITTSVEYEKYSKSDNWANPNTTVMIGSMTEIEADSYRGNNGEISMDAIYNKIRVKDSFYYADLFIPDIFDDNALTNRFGEDWKSKEMEVPVTGLHSGMFETEDQRHSPNYVDKKGQHYDATDLGYHYYEKWFDNRHYKSVYRNPTTHLTGNTYEQAYIAGLLTMIPDDITGSTVTNLSSDILNDNFPTGTTGGMCLTRYQGGTIVDVASVKRGYNEEEQPPVYAWLPQFNEAENKLSFDRYLCLSTMGMPYFNGTLAAGTREAITPSGSSAALEYWFPNLFELNSGHTCPVIFDSTNSFITINGSAIWERYFKRPYINPDWTSDMSAKADKLIGGEGDVRCDTDFPALYFKLKIGDFWWNGTGWSRESCCFCVFTDAKFKDEVYDDDKDKFLWDGNWNTELSIINNVEWTEFCDASGYKIQLTEGIDLSNEILFEVHSPSLLQRRAARINHSGNYYYDDGNGYFCWLKDLKLNICNKYSNQVQDDVVYENEIDGYSINEMSEITCRFTTFPERAALAYSNVGMDRNQHGSMYTGLLHGVMEDAISGEFKRPEENIVEKYYNMYSVPVKREDITVDLSFSPLDRIKDGYWDEHFAMLGNEIDYAESRQNITIVRMPVKCTIVLTKVSHTGDTIPADGATVVIKVNSDCPWTVSVNNPDYGSFSGSTSGTGGGDEYFTFNALRNRGHQRDVIFTVSTEDNRATVSYVQYMSTGFIDLIPEVLDFPASGGTLYFDIDSDVRGSINKQEN